MPLPSLISRALKLQLTTPFPPGRRRRALQPEPPPADRDDPSDTLLLDWCEDLVGAVVLDLGCGRGELARRLNERGAREVHGIDPRRSRVTLARQEAPPWSNLSFRVADVAAPFDLLAGEYDLVLASGVFGRLERSGLVQALAHARRGLREGGRLLFAIPHPARPVATRGMDRHLTFADYVGILAEAGFPYAPEVREFTGASADGKSERRLAFRVQG